MSVRVCKCVCVHMRAWICVCVCARMHVHGCVYVCMRRIKQGLLQLGSLASKFLLGVT